MCWFLPQRFDMSTAPKTSAIDEFFGPQFPGMGNPATKGAERNFPLPGRTQKNGAAMEGLD